MNIAERFTRAVELLPDEVRARLDGDAPLDWAALASAGLGADIGHAAAAPRLLPEPVETLVHRLVEDVGIVPGDVALGVERQGAAAGWLQSVKVEGFGESYQIRNERSGEVHLGVRPEAVAGYATIALELAAASTMPGPGGWRRATAIAERPKIAGTAWRNVRYGCTPGSARAPRRTGNVPPRPVSRAASSTRGIRKAPTCAPRSPECG